MIKLKSIVVGWLGCAKRVNPPLVMSTFVPFKTLRLHKLANLSSSDPYRFLPLSNISLGKWVRVSFPLVVCIPHVRKSGL